MVQFEQEGEYFASIFPSVARQKEDEEERQQIKKMLDLLDELESQESTQSQPYPLPPYYYPMMHPMMYPMAPQMVPQGHGRPRVEFYKVITEDGDIVDTEDGKHRVPVNRNKVHTLDDIPKENEWEAIFGTPREEPPVVDVKAGRRVKDGEKFYTAKINGESVYAEWGGIPFLALVSFIFVGIALIVFFTRLNRPSYSRHTYHPQAPAKPYIADVDIQRYIFEQVDKRMSERYNLKPVDFR